MLHPNKKVAFEKRRRERQAEYNRASSLKRRRGGGKAGGNGGNRGLLGGNVKSQLKAMLANLRRELNADA